MEKHLRARVPFPARETSKNGDVWTWTKEKAQHESRLAGADGELWLVHGKLYDLSEFVSKHPGGPDWMLLTKGQDVTEAFEVHHLNSAKAEAVLRKYFVRDADPDYVGRYTWDPASFYPTLKRRVSKFFKTRSDGRPDTSHTLYFQLLCAGVMALHFATFAALLYSGGSMWVALLAGYTLQAFHGIGHNSLHMADNWWMYAYDFCGWKHHRHRVSHALSHHLHPNTVIDLEHPEPGSFVFTSNRHRNKPWVVLIGPWMMLSGPLRDIFSLWHGLITGEEKWRPEFSFNILQLVLLLAYSSSPLTGFAAFCIIHLVCGFCIEWAGFGLHRSIFCWTDGDPNQKIDFGEHCLATTADHDIDMPLMQSLYMYQILNNHGIHHLFPTVCKSRMHEIMPIFHETCTEFGIPWKEYDHQDMFWSLWKSWTVGLWLDRPSITTPAAGHPLVPGSKIRVLPFPGQSFGATITGVDLGNLCKAELKIIKSEYSKRGVLCFPQQKLTPEQEVTFSRHFPYSRTCSEVKLCGPLAKTGFDREKWEKFKLHATPEIQLRGFGDLKDHYGVTGSLDTSKAAREFHSDSLHEYDTPPIFTSLYCLATPGADQTLFIDGVLAYTRLSPAEQEKVDSLFVQYKREPTPLDKSGLKGDLNPENLDSLGSWYADAVKDAAPDAEVVVSEVHPLVWTHPPTGRKAIISAAMWIHRIVDADGTPWTVADSHDYLYSLLAPVATEEHIYSHNWSIGDLVCFDNRVVMHSAAATPASKGRAGCVGLSSTKGDRLLHQIIQCGDQIPSGPAGSGVGNPIVNPNVVAAR
jgi:alpha-ketoglutarate-dependent taurine dioxygenase